MNRWQKKRKRAKKPQKTNKPVVSNHNEMIFAPPRECDVPNCNIVNSLKIENWSLKIKKDLI